MKQKSTGALVAMLRDAMHELGKVGRPVAEIFASGLTEKERTVDATYAYGLIEGASVARGSTPLELLERFDLI